MALAKELLEKGEKQVVIDYLDLCSAFWERGQKAAAAWKSAVQRSTCRIFPSRLCGTGINIFFILGNILIIY